MSALAFIHGQKLSFELNVDELNVETLQKMLDACGQILNAAYSQRVTNGVPPTNPAASTDLERTDRSYRS